MLVKEKRGTLKDFSFNDREVDPVCLEWFETGKRILHKKSRKGQEVVLKFLERAPAWMQDDVVYADDKMILAIEILPCEAIRIQPRSQLETAAISYEIGNKHLPLFYEGEALLVPFDPPLYQLLQVNGYVIEKTNARLQAAFRTTVSAHEHS